MENIQEQVKALIEQYDKALMFIYEQFFDKVDKAGKPYVSHPIRMADKIYADIYEDENWIKNAKPEDYDSLDILINKYAVTALLHDVLEDCDVTEQMLIDMGFDKDIIEAVKMLTHDPKVRYDVYVNKLAENDIARFVKVYDLEDNMDMTRIDRRQLTATDMNRLYKYHNAWRYLTGRSASFDSEDLKLFRDIYSK